MWFALNQNELNYKNVYSGYVVLFSFTKAQVACIFRDEPSSWRLTEISGWRRLCHETGPEAGVIKSVSAEASQLWLSPAIAVA